MSGVRLIAAVATRALLACVPAPAWATEIPPGRPFAADHVLLFSGADLSRTASFLYGGFVWSPDDLAAEGFMLKLLSGSGRYAGSGAVTGHDVLLSVLPGWRLKWNRLETTFYAGFDAQNHWFHPDDPTNALSGPHIGLRLSAEAWYEPATAMMAQGWATWSSIDGGYCARAAFGWRVFDALYLGPETQALGNAETHQLRLGVHLTAWHTGAFEWSAALGLAHQPDQPGADHLGAYARLGVLTRY